MPVDREELLVESVAFLGAAAAGLQVDAEAATYLASWGAENAVQEIRGLAEQTDTLAARIETAVTATGGDSTAVEDQAQAA